MKCFPHPSAISKPVWSLCLSHGVNMRRSGLACWPSYEVSPCCCSCCRRCWPHVSASFLASATCQLYRIKLIIVRVASHRTSSPHSPKWSWLWRSWLCGWRWAWGWAWGWIWVWSRIAELAALAGCLPLIVADKHAELAAKAIYLKLPVNFGCC